MKIIITEKISEKGIDTLLKAGATVDVKDNLSRQELLDCIAEYDGIIVRSVTKINEEFYQYAKNLKVVGRAGNGVDNIEMEGATKRGIIVVNTPESNIVSAAELTIGLLIASCRNIPQADALLKSRIWDRTNLKGVELQGKTIGVVGLGRIGGLVTTRVQSFGMKVVAYDPYISEARFKKYGVERMEKLEDLMKVADFITVHTPKTEETLGMIGEEQFKFAKKGVRVINCARGGIIDENALAKALNEGIVASAGIDVLVGEPHPTSILLDFDNVVVTPHIGADTIEAQDNVGVTIALEVLSALRGEMAPNSVNLPTLHQQELEALTSFLQMGETLGKLYHQLEKDAVEKVEIVYSGDVAELQTSILTLAILKGIFEPVLKERVNYVNAGIIAQNRGIAVVESKESAKANYANLIKVKVYSRESVFSVSGTVFGKGELRIVDVNGFEFDVMPAPYMLVAENMDKPGMIGQIGTLLGASKINIATMQVSRNYKENRAMMFLTIDSEATKETLKLISGVEGIFKVRFVKM